MPSLPGFLLAVYSLLAPSFLCLLSTLSIFEHWICSSLSSMPFSFSRLSLPLHHSAHSYGCCYHLYGPSSQICISSSDSLQVPDSWIPLLLGKLRFKTELEMFSKHFFTLCPLSQLLLHKLGEFSFTTSLDSQTSDPPIFSF